MPDPADPGSGADPASALVVVRQDDDDPRAVRRALLHGVAAEVLGDGLGRRPERGLGVEHRRRAAEAVWLPAERGVPAVAARAWPPRPWPGRSGWWSCRPSPWPSWLTTVGGRRRGRASRSWSRLTVGLPEVVADRPVVVGAVGAAGWLSSSEPGSGPLELRRGAAEHAVLELEDRRRPGPPPRQDDDAPGGRRARRPARPMGAGARRVRRAGRAGGWLPRASGGWAVPGRRIGHARRLTGRDRTAEPCGTGGQSRMPSRRAERARCRVARIRRSRLTSIGSKASASGRVDQGVEHLVVAGGRHVEQLADGLLLGAGVLPPLALEGQDLAVARRQLRGVVRRPRCPRSARRP